MKKFFLFLLVLISFVGAIMLFRVPGDNSKIKVFIVDFFTGFDPHGKEVYKAFSEASYDRVDVTFKKIDPVLDVISYLQILGEIKQYAIENPGKRIVVNISLSTSEVYVTEALLINDLKELGVIIIAAAGNDGKHKSVCPAAFPGVLAVGTVIGGRKHPESNYGRHLDFCAEGYQFGATTSLDGKKVGVVNVGSSVSAPRAAGLLSYIMMRRPDLTISQIISQMKSDCVKISSPEFSKGLLGAGKISPVRTLIKLDPFFRMIILFYAIAGVIIFFGLFNPNWIGVHVCSLFVSICLIFACIGFKGVINGSLLGLLILVSSYFYFICRYDDNDYSELERTPNYPVDEYIKIVNEHNFNQK